MEYKVVIKDSFVLIGYSAAGRWGDELVYPIPSLWEKSTTFIKQKHVKKLWEFAFLQEATITTIPVELR